MEWQGKIGQFFIDGEWVDPSGTETLEVISPVTEEVFATVACAEAPDVDRAVEAARRAFDFGPWPQMSVDARVEVLRRFAELYRDHEDQMALLITEEMGCPITLSRTFQAGAPRRILESFLDLASTYPFRSVRRSETGTSLVTREPVGVVAAVVPWNVPQSIMMLKLAPALLIGCTMIVKPAPETPLDSYLMVELLQQAGLPEGVVNLLPADRVGSELLISNGGVDKVAFTGSTTAGRRIGAICGNDLRRVTLELGGKSAAIFLNDADLDESVEKLRFGSLRNSGQVCSLKTRLIVSKRRETEFLDRLVALVESMTIGDPRLDATQIGPMATARHRDVVENYIRVGKDQGGRVVLGGARPAGFDKGWFVEPTIFAGVGPNDVIAQEEIFGPVLSVLTFDDEAEAIDIANNSTYGLNGAVFSSDIDHAMAIAQHLRTGTVELNGNPAGLSAPMGGFKNSGIGREQGIEGLDSYSEPRSLGIPVALADKFAAN
jgi:acyl-CoA reductase-like NAD-dependent aldehyde dehydrogenase